MGIDDKGAVSVYVYRNTVITIEQGNNVDLNQLTNTVGLKPPREKDF